MANVKAETESSTDMTNTKTTDGAFIKPSLFSLRKLRMKIALRLVPSGTPADEVLKAFGVDIDSRIKEGIDANVQNRILEAASKLVANSVGEIDPNVIAASISQSTKLTDLQKSQAIAILTATKNRLDYLQ